MFHRKHQHREPLFVELDGEKLVYVPLYNHDQPAILDAQDFVRLMEEEGMSGQWWYHESVKTPTQRYRYVVGVRKGNNNPVQVARIVMGAKKGDRIRYRNNDTRDLRRSNLLFQHSKGPHVSRAWLKQVANAEALRETQGRLKSTRGVTRGA